jgi:hypothetical protein
MPNSISSLVDLDYLIANTNAWSYDAAGDMFLAEFPSDDGEPAVDKVAFDKKDPRIYPILKHALTKWGGHRCATALKLTLQFWKDPHALLYSENGRTGGELHGTDNESRYAMRFLGLLSQPDHHEFLFDVEYCDMEKYLDGVWFSTGAWRKGPQSLSRALLEAKFPGSIGRMQCLLTLGVSRETVASQVFRAEGPVEVDALPTLNDSEIGTDAP